jgi:hypothetical protein
VKEGSLPRLDGRLKGEEKSRGAEIRLAGSRDAEQGRSAGGER